MRTPLKKKKTGIRRRILLQASLAPGEPGRTHELGRLCASMPKAGNPAYHLSLDHIDFGRDNLSPLRLFIRTERECRYTQKIRLTLYAP